MNVYTSPMSIMVVKISVSVIRWWWDDFFTMPAVLFCYKAAWPFSFESLYRKIMNLILKRFYFWTFPLPLYSLATFENRQNVLLTKILSEKFFLIQWNFRNFCLTKCFVDKSFAFKNFCSLLLVYFLWTKID